MGLNLAEAVWTGKEMIVFGAKLDNNNALPTPVAEYGLQPIIGQLAGAPLAPDLSAGLVDRVDRLGGCRVGLRPRRGGIRPEADAWQDAHDPPMDPGECYPHGAFTEGVMFAHFCWQGAVYHAAEDEWRRIPWGDRIVAGRPVAAVGVFLFAGATHETTHNALWAFKPAK